LVACRWVGTSAEKIIPAIATAGALLQLVLGGGTSLIADALVASRRPILFEALLHIGALLGVLTIIAITAFGLATPLAWIGKKPRCVRSPLWCACAQSITL
jgi:hypothetical protein